MNCNPIDFQPIICSYFIFNLQEFKLKYLATMQIFIAINLLIQYYMCTFIHRVVHHFSLMNQITQAS